LFPPRDRLMKRPTFCANAIARCIRSADKQRRPIRGDDMSRKQKQLVRKPSKKIADARRVRYGASWAPRKVRFGASWSPAILRK
jgi:hypothetical protein